MRWLLRNYLSIDPRTLGLVRIVIGFLLFTDLIKRCLILPAFYTNDGLLPNHRVLWSPPREWVFSPLLALSHRHEVTLAFVLIGLIYTCFLFGYRTRCAHVLSWLSLVALQMRVDVLSNGADFVFSDLVLWTSLLPLGQRFSLDALRRSLTARPDATLSALAQTAGSPKPTEPVISGAVLAAALQLSVIYFFNAVHKNGATWQSGEAVYYMLHQERIVTALGLWVREHAAAGLLSLLSYGTLLVEIALPVLIVSPWGRPWTRRAAIAGIFGLHGSIALLANLGLFSPVMMTFSLLLLGAQDWEAWQAFAARSQRRRQLYVEAATGSAWLLARIFKRLDLYGRIEVLPMAALDAGTLPKTHGGYVVRRVEDGALCTLDAAFRELLRVLPAAFVLAAAARLLQPVHAPLARWAAPRRQALSAWFGLPGVVADGEHSGSTPPPTAATNSRFARSVARARVILQQAVVLMLSVVAVSQILVENPAIPRVLRLPQPRFLQAAVSYTRLNQGWSMFAPNAPTQDMWVVVDAETIAGRHVDPLNELGSRVVDPLRRDVPARLGYSAAICDYIVRIVDQGDLHDPLRDWIMAYDRRTRRPEDRITHFSAYLIEQESPAPGESAPRNVRSRVFLRE